MSDFAADMWGIAIGGVLTLIAIGIWYWWETR